MTTMMYQHLLDDLGEAVADPTVALHHVRIPAFHGVSMFDFSQTDAMIRAGKEAMEAYLSNPQPLDVRAAARLQAATAATALPGASVYVPRRRRH
jgi:hypothetical protein